MDNELHVNHFLQRLNSLQRLCSSTDSRFPNALLFVVGPDSRSNKGSLNVLKYLFQGATGLYLLEGALDSHFEPLEEVVLLIQELSVSIFWSHRAKESLGPLFSRIPLFMEYMPSILEEEDVDLFQSRKCVDFKRMMLEAVEFGRTIGIPIPMGYEDIQEVETWPILASFGLDDVFTPTGFFTSKYAIADISEYLEVLFKSVDGYVVTKAIETLSESIVPHVDQVVAILDTETPDQRCRLTADEIIGPLDMLFEFGELDCPFPVDPQLKPIALFGVDSSLIGSSTNIPANEWRSRMVGKKSLLSIIEACEPSTGMRWCRTYFLQRGKSIFSKNINERLDLSLPVRNSFNENLHRLEALYTKLFVGLRTSVKIGFSLHTDVLEAGTFIQKSMDSIMKGGSIPGYEGESPSYFGGFDLNNVVLLPGERLKLHMDCMNAYGQIITIDDVDEMGGTCWTYIRVSVHNIAFEKGFSNAVSVGDTFLFTSLSGLLKTQFSLPNENHRSPSAAVSAVCYDKHSLPILLADCYCVTHAIQYYRCYIGFGDEEASAQRLLASTRSPHMLEALGLGRSLDDIDSGSIELKVFTDHPLIPFANAHVKTYSDGFLIEKMNTKCLPILISMSTDVERMWTIDSQECLLQSSRLVPPQSDDIPDIDSPNGNFIIFRLKLNEEIIKSLDSVDNSWNNPLAAILPGHVASEPHHIAFFIATGSRSAKSMSKPCASWRNVLKANDIQIHRGSDVRAPEAILTSFLVGLDHMSFEKNNEVFESSSFMSSEFIANLAKDMESFSIPSCQIYPALGYSGLRCVHALAESFRLDNSFEANKSKRLELLSPAAITATNARRLIVVSGLSGSGAGFVGSQLHDRLKISLKSSKPNVSVQFCVVDISILVDKVATDRNEDDYSEYFTKLLVDCVNGFNFKAQDSVTVISLLHSPESYIRLPILLSLISEICDGEILQLISVVCTLESKQTETTRSHGKLKILRYGEELWKSSTSELFQSGLCDIAIFIDKSTSSANRSGGGSTGGYAHFKDWLSVVNPKVVCLKLTPSSNKIDDDVFSGLLEFVFSRKSRPYNRYSNMTWITRGYGSSFKHNGERLTMRKSSSALALASITSGISHRHFHLPANERWSASLLLTTLHVLFPKATENITSSFGESSWHIPPNIHNLRGWARIVELAKVKVFSKQQLEEGRKTLEKKIANYSNEKSSELLQLIRSNLLSVKAFIKVSSPSRTESSASASDVQTQFIENDRVQGQSCWISIEANEGSILIKRILESEISHACCLTLRDEVTAHGYFSSTTEGGLRDLFNSCVEHKSTKKTFLNRVDISEVTKFEIQSKSGDVPLPGNCFYDGHSFIDVSGHRHRFRLDIDDLVENYLRCENAKIQYYNESLLSTVLEYLQT